MLSIWPENQPMSRVADFACCAILDFRSPSGNDYNNQEMPSGMSAVASATLSDLAANAVLSLTGLKQSGAATAEIYHLANYRKGYLGQQGSRNRADFGTGRATGFGSGTNPPAQGTGFGSTGNRHSGNR